MLCNTAQGPVRLVAGERQWGRSGPVGAHQLVKQQARYWHRFCLRRERPQMWVCGNLWA